MIMDVYSNGVPIPFQDEYFAPMRNSAHLIDSATALNDRFHEDGFLYLGGIIDRQRVLDLREAYFSLFPPSYFEAGTGPREAVFSGQRPRELAAHGTHGHPAHSFVRSRTFREFTETCGLDKVAAALLGGPVILLPRQTLRHYDSSTTTASRVHTDFAYMDRGSDRTVTVWIPVGDCPIESGGLIYLDGSHRIDPRTLDELRPVTDRAHDPRPLTHDLEWAAERTGHRWMWANYLAGDIAVHSPHIAHASLANTTKAMRMSIDIRYQLAGTRQDERWLRLWAGDDGN
jgi:ectoine hydroxylase-related dioxygenase (phytanoyl-CoA dioxygenase family)